MAMRSTTSAPSVSEVVTALRSTPLLADVEPKVLERLASEGRIHDFRKGTYLFHQGDEAPDVHFLLRGRVEVTSLSVTGHRQFHTTLNPPQFFGELGVLGQMPRTAGAIALEDTAVLVIGGEAWLDFLSVHPAALREILRVLARQIQAHEAFVEDLLFLDLKGRVAKRLLQLVSPSIDEVPGDGAVLPSVVTHADLASLSGGSRENVTRILSEFQRRGLVTKQERRYKLKNIAGLRKLAGL
jgi:CRP-like cAMP-binding protein